MSLERSNSTKRGALHENVNFFSTILHRKDLFFTVPGAMLE
jgi:hypothetical protein